MAPIAMFATFIAAVSLGIARHALEAFVALSQSKVYIAWGSHCDIGNAFGRLFVFFGIVLVIIIGVEICIEQQHFAMLTANLVSVEHPESSSIKEPGQDDDWAGPLPHFGDALTIAILLTLVGIAILYSINPKTAMFGAISSIRP